MDDIACPRCKTTKYRNPSLKLMVNICGHALCESCVDLLFLKGSGSCPDCDIALRRSNFRIQLFEDATVEKEVDIRRRVLRDYNRKREDFVTLREYNDYLEEVETIIYNLANDIDIINTNKRIEQYKKENKELIIKNKSKVGREEYELEELLEYEKQQDEHRKEEVKIEETEAKKKKIREKEALIDELMFSSDNAKNIVQTFAQNTKDEEESKQKAPVVKASKFSTGIQFGRQSQTNFLPVPIEEGPQFVYSAPVQIADGPVAPGISEIIQKNYLNNVRSETEQELAGGYRAQIACLRALQEAFAGLYHVTQSPQPVKYDD